MTIGVPAVDRDIGEPFAASEDHVGFDRNTETIRADGQPKQFTDLPVCRSVDTIIDAVDLKAASDGEARGAAATHCDLVTELQRHGAARGQRMSAGEQDCSAAIAASIKHGTNPIDG